MNAIKTVPNDVLMPEVERILRSGSKVTLRTKGGSMFPFIRGGQDSVVLEYDPLPHVGDIVLAHTPAGDYVLHRLVSKGAGEGFVLMGDGNVHVRELCAPDAVCGRVVAIMRGGRQVDPRSRREVLKARLWIALLPVRRWLLAFLRRVA